MKKGLLILFVLALVMVSATVAWASPGQAKKESLGSENSPSVKLEAKAGGTVNSSVYEDVYGPQGYKGLLNAYENVKGTPAEERIAEKLRTKYDIDVEASEED